MTGQEALARLVAAYDDRIGEALRRKAAGATLVGYFLNSVPTELILAAGLDPIRIVGAPHKRAPIADVYMEEYMDGEVRSLFGSLLEGEFAFLDLLVVPRTSEVYLQLYYFLLEIQNWESGSALPRFYLFDLLQAPTWSVLQYDIGRLKELAARLAEVGRMEIDDARLRTAITLTNRLRATVKAFLAKGRDGGVSGTDMLKVIGAASVLPPAEAIEAIGAITADAPPPTDRGVRLMLKGSPQSDERVTTMIEAAGGYVVAQDHIAGEISFAHDIPEGGDPWEALAAHYRSATPGPRALPQSNQDAQFIGLAKRSNTQGVIFFHDEWDDTLGWEYPDQKRLLEEVGIPSLFLKRQPYYDPPVDAQSRQIQAFVSSLRGETA